MPSVPERLFASVSRACAVIVAGVPLVAVGILLWSGITAALSARAFAVNSGLFATAGFTLVVCATAGVVGGAIGIGCAVAAEELAPAAIRGAIEAAIGFLGALPAVAYGWFALVFFAPLVDRETLGGATQFLVATLLLAVMVAPTTCALVTRALRRIPDLTRHAAAACGASRLQTAALVVVPAFRRRIAAAVLAAFARAIGEATAVQILFATLARRGIEAPGTTASWLLSTLVVPANSVAGEVSLAALALIAVAVACGLFVAREYRGMQWA